MARSLFKGTGVGRTDMNHESILGGLPGLLTAEHTEATEQSFLFEPMSVNFVCSVAKSSTYEFQRRSV